MSKILDINCSLQTPNMVLKSDVDNSIKQITDRASKIPLVVVGSEYAIYNYGDGIPYFKCLTARYSLIDSEITTNSTLCFRINNNDHSTEATAGVLYKKGNLIIRQKANANNLEIVINSVVVIDYAYTHSVKNYYALFFDGTNVYLVENGLIVAKETYTGLVATGTTDIFSDGTNYFKGFCYSISCYSNDLYKISGKSVTDNVGFKSYDFTYFKRHQNKDGTKKLFLTSRNLEDAVIDDTNQITSIKSEVGGDLNTKTANVSAPPILDNGFKFQSGVSDQIKIQSYRASLGYILDGIELSDWDSFTFSFWHNPINTDLNNWANYFSIVRFSDNANLILGGFLYNWSAYPNKYVWYNGSFHPTTRPYTVNNWNHVCLVYKDNMVYILVNGILENSYTTTFIPAYSLLTLTTGGYPSVAGSSLQDDIMFSLDTIYDPTGCPIGWKLFEPPRRKSLDDTIIQYPTP